MSPTNVCDYRVDSSGKCPYCGVVVKFIAPSRWTAREQSYKDARDIWVKDGRRTAAISISECPHCERMIVGISTAFEPERGRSLANEFEAMIYPVNRARFVPPEVPHEIAEDYSEAAAVLGTSRKASAALSRRCLQAVLSAHGFKKQNLSDCIDDALPTLPDYVSENLDAIRTVGNFGAHPLKNTQSGSIVEVEPTEAEFLLDVLDDVFDHYYVKPASAVKKRDSINKKLASAGKQPMKTK